jgi:hypothetical protein
MSSDVDASPLHPVVSRRWRLSPAYISVLLHCYCRCDEIPNRNAPVIVDALREFIEYGLIVAGGQCDHGFEVTPKGRALVQMLCSTPLPDEINGFQDPRTGQWVGERQGS